MKTVLLILGNKKGGFFSAELDQLTKTFSAKGWLLDSIQFVAYDDGEAIVNAFSAANTACDNLLVLSPQSMEQTLKEYLTKLYAAHFAANELHTDTKNVYLLFNGSAVKQAEEQVLPSLIERYGIHNGKMVFKTVGATAEEVQQAIARAKAVFPNVDYFVTDSFGDCKLEIFYEDTTPKMLLDEVSRAVLSVLNDYVYALEDITLAEQLFRLLTLRRMKIAVAESFTGGGICQKLVEVSGVSAVFYEGINTYSNESKMARLGVKETTLKQHGAVSEETAYEMAAGLIQQGNCDVSIATTGIAGPKSDNTQKPVGLCYLAVGLQDSVAVHRFVLSGNRESITKTAINLALFLAYKRIK